MIRLLVDFHGVLQTTHKVANSKGVMVGRATPMPGSQHAIATLSNYYEIVLVSAMFPEIIPGTAKFLEYYFPEIDPGNYVFTYNKSVVYGDIMIDDSESHLDTSLCPIKILFGYHIQENNNYIQFANWNKLTPYLVEIAKAYWDSFC